jgi:predicted aconitase with swiveling domain
LDNGRILQAKGLRGIDDAWVEGDVLKLEGAVSFLGDVDPAEGTIAQKGIVDDIKGRILVFPEGKGSTVGSYVIYNLKLERNAPRAMVMLKADAIITMGCIAAGIPLVHMLSRQDFDSLHSGMRVAVNSARGQVRIMVDQRVM